MVFYTPYIMEETEKPSPPTNRGLDSLNDNFLDSELKEQNIYLSSFEDVKSNKCHPSEIDFSSPNWYSLYSLFYCRKNEFQERQECMFSNYQGYSILFKSELEMSLSHTQQSTKTPPTLSIRPYSNMSTRVFTPPTSPMLAYRLVGLKSSYSRTPRRSASD